MLKSDAVHWHARWVVGFSCEFIAWVVESSESRGERRGCGKVVRAPGRKTRDKDAVSRDPRSELNDDS